MAEVYALFSGRDGRVRYVGQTTGPRADRFKQHLKTPSSNLAEWFRNEWHAGYPVECILLESCADDVRFVVERRWMAKFPDLLNDRMSYRTRLTAIYSKAPKIPEITAYMRRYYFNVGGFRGVHYDRHWDCYKVLLFDGEWLFGDLCDEMMPGWGGNMWFPDRTAAVIARDKARKWRPYLKWPRDIEQSDDELFSVESCPGSAAADLEWPLSWEMRSIPDTRHDRSLP